MWLPLMHTPPGTWNATQPCTRTRNQTSDPLVCRLALNPLRHTSQGSSSFKQDMKNINTMSSRIKPYQNLLWSHKSKIEIRKQPIMFRSQGVAATTGPGVMLRPDAACLKDFEKVWSMSQDGPFIWISPWKLFVVWGFRESPGRVNCVSQVDGDSDMVPTFLADGLWKGTMASASTLVWQKIVPTLSSQPNAGKFKSSLYVLGGFQASAPVLELKGSESK